MFTLHDLLGAIEADPTRFGFTNVADPCWTGDFTRNKSGTLCSPTLDEQNKYLFWDEIHPTAAGHLLTAEFALDALNVGPEPSTWAMMLIGFAGLGFAGYRGVSKRAAV